MIKKSKETAYTFIFFLFCWGDSYATGEIMAEHLGSHMITGVISAWAVFFAAFTAAFGLIYRGTGERLGKTLFVMAGGLFTVIFSIIALLNEHMRHGHWHELPGWRYVIDIMGFSYFWLIPLPLVMAAVFGANLYHKRRQS
ncbi:MAG: hypothetical protein K2K57_00040 [Oscillospiraceae bacterium]|nr:hypothetical protein [Oscillospiraceae bacterium]